MGGATKARANDSKPILDGYYKLGKNSPVTGSIVNIKRSGYNTYTVFTKDSHYIYSRLIVADILVNSIYLGSNIDSISVLYKE